MKSNLGLWAKRAVWRYLPVILVCGVVSCRQQDAPGHSAEDGATPPAVQPAYKSVGEDVLAEEQSSPELQVSLTDLQRFRTATRNMEQDAREWQARMDDLMDTEGLGRERYLELQQAIREGRPVNATESELTLYNQVNVGLEQMRSDMKRNMIVHIVGAGLTRDRFREINEALAKDGALREKYAEISD